MPLPRWKDLGHVDVIVDQPQSTYDEYSRQQSSLGVCLTTLIPALLVAYGFGLVALEASKPPTQTFTLARADNVTNNLVNLSFAPGVVDPATFVTTSFLPAKLDSRSECLAAANLSFVSPASFARFVNVRSSGSGATSAVLQACPSQAGLLVGGTTEPSSGVGVLVRLNADCASTSYKARWPAGVRLPELLGVPPSAPLLTFSAGANAVALPSGLLDAAFCTGSTVFQADRGAVGDPTSAKVNLDGSKVVTVSAKLKVTQLIDLIAGKNSSTLSLTGLTATPTFATLLGNKIDMKDDARACTLGRRIAFQCSTATGACSNGAFAGDTYFQRYAGFSSVGAACAKACMIAFKTMQAFSQPARAANDSRPLATTSAFSNSAVDGSGGSVVKDPAAVAAAKASPSSLAWSISGMHGEAYNTNDAATWWSYSRFLQAQGQGLSSGACALMKDLVATVSAFDGCSLNSTRESKIDECYVGPYSNPMRYNNEDTYLASHACSARQAGEPTFSSAPFPLLSASMSAMGCGYAFRPFSNPAEVSCGLTISLPSPVQVVTTAAPAKLAGAEVTYITGSFASALAAAAAMTPPGKVCTRLSFAALSHPLDGLDQDLTAWYASSEGDPASMQAGLSAMNALPFDDNTPNCIDATDVANAAFATYTTPVFKVDAWIVSERPVLQCGAADVLTTRVGADVPAQRPILAAGKQPIRVGSSVSAVSVQAGVDPKYRCEDLSSSAAYGCEPLLVPRFQGWNAESSYSPLLFVLFSIEPLIDTTTISPPAYNILAVFSNVMALWTTVYFLMVIVKFRVAPVVRACCPAIPDCHDPEREAAYLAKKLERQAAEARKIAELKVVSPVLAKVVSTGQLVDVTNPIGSGAAKTLLAVPSPAEALAAAAPAAATPTATPTATPAVLAPAADAVPGAAATLDNSSAAGDAAAVPSGAAPAGAASAVASADAAAAAAAKKGGPIKTESVSPNDIDSSKVAKYAKKRFESDELPEGWDWKEDGESNVYYVPPKGVFGGTPTTEDPRATWEIYLDAHMQYAAQQLAAGKRVSWA